MSELHERLGSLARDLRAGASPEETMRGIIQAAVALVPGCDAAGITLTARRHRIEVSAANDGVSRLSADKQVELGEGPSLDAVWDERVVSVPDLEHETRWPRWSPWVVSALGVRSMLCVQLFTHGEQVGALNLYGMRRHAFDGEAVDTALSVAAHAAVATAASREVEHLRAALDSRTLIAQATGLVMATYRLDRVAAFDVMRRLSMDENRKIVDVATEVVQQHEASLLRVRAGHGSTGGVPQPG